MSSYDYWNKQQKEIHNANYTLLYEDYTQELKSVYERKLEIIEEILIDLSPQLDDEQYEGTTSWQYEKELELLDKKQIELEPVVQKRIEIETHKQFLEDIGMSQVEYDKYLQEQDALAKQRRINKIKKNFIK